MNISFKAVGILVAGGFILLAFYYFTFKIPVSPAVTAPTEEENTADVPVPSAVPPPASGAKISQSVVSGGSYSSILGEADLDKSLFDAEVIDANAVTGDKAEFLAVGQSYDENNLPSADFCASLPGLAASVIAKIEARTVAVKSKRADLLNKMTNGRKDRDAIRDSFKLQLSLMQDEYFARLGSKVPNAGGGKAAAEKFVSLIIDASKVKRTGVASVTATFRTGIDEAFLARTGLINTAVAAYKNSATTAFDKAKADCSSGVAVETVRTNLRTALFSAKTKFNADHSAAEKLSGVILPLIEQRKATMVSILSAFKASLDKARTDLKKAYPQAE